MRALTVRQPWAWAIVHGGKDVENRSRSLGPYRGLVAIHAGLTWDGDPYDAALRLPTLHRAMLTHRRSVESWVAFDESMNAARGHVIGIVDLVDVHDDGACFDLSVRLLAHLYRTDPDAFHTFPDNGSGGVLGRARLCSPWAQGDAQHIVLANPRPLVAPIPWRGALGLWTVPADLEAAIREQVTL